MPWKSGYTITDERSLADKSVEWPENRNCAVAIVVDYSVSAGKNGITKTDIKSQFAEYGRKVEVWGLLDLLDKYRMRATFAVPAIMAETFKESVKEIVKRGHEVAAHGLLHEDVSLLPKEEEKKRIEIVADKLCEITGISPVGWFALPRQGDPFAGGTISINTVDLLISAGFEYLGNGMADDIPHYWVTDFNTCRNILTLPYYYHYDDQFFLMYPPIPMGTGLENSETLLENWQSEFNAAYKRNRYFSIFLHPYLIQWGNRLEILEKLLFHINGCLNIWNATGKEVAKHWKNRYPADTYLNLKESVWRDYPGSLS
jgi:peptidoglycan-N-acetylglucosamine deacetylase